ncbi:hypothetical protein CAAN1_16S01948 [[Candida] anglica]|uniref:Uncharacterized protein n=1 Tax=[Candida] anglica TaxID=148631 RepID=A0ABP0EAR5_9ASCO
MDLDLDIDEPREVKRPVFKKKKVLNKKNKVKRESGFLNEEEEEGQLKQIIQDDSTTQESSGKSIESSWNSGIGGFRKLKRTRESTVSLVEEESIDVKMNDDEDEAHSNNISSSSADLGAGQEPNNDNGILDFNNYEPMNPYLTNINPPEDIYDLDLPVDSTEENSGDNSEDEQNQHFKLKEILSIEEQKENLQHKIFELKDLKQSNIEEIEAIKNKFEMNKEKKLNMIKEFETNLIV